MKSRTLLWIPVDEVGLEQLSLLETENGHIADSLVLTLEKNEPVRLWYRMLLDVDWCVRSLHVYSTTGLLESVNLPFDLHGPSVVLNSDGAGNWTDRNGRTEHMLAGCIDIDISMTPFTNTLPIRRLNLAPGESADISVVYINAPGLEVSKVLQRYTCLEQNSAGAIYRFEGLNSGFTAEIQVDPDGLVLDYPGLFERANSLPDQTNTGRSISSERVSP